MMKGEVTIVFHSVYLDFMLRRSRKIAVISVFERSQQVLKSFCANINLCVSREIQYDGRKYEFVGDNKFEVFISPVIVDKEKIYHAVLISGDIGKKLLVSSPDRIGMDFYNFLMESYDLPLLDWWGEFLFKDGIKNRKINADNEETCCIFGPFSNSADFEIQGKRVQDLKIYDVSSYGIADLRDSIQSLFARRDIYISPNKQLPIQSKNMDEYFKEYGNTMVENLQRMIHPLSDLNGEITSLSLRNMRLYPQQAAMVNGVLKRFRKSKYAILNEGMGVGKTIQAVSICEGYHVEKYLRANPKKTVSDIYSDRDSIKYRNIIMCPGHMVEKWAAEISREIPYAKSHILSDFSQLVALRKRGAERTEREFWVVSKDFAKLSYMQQPSPIKIGYNRPVSVKECSVCGDDFLTPGKHCLKCGGIGVKGQEVSRATGMLCPECGEILLENTTQNLYEQDKYSVLMPEDFAHQSKQNQNCYYCGAILWQPFVRNIDQVNIFSPKIREKTWIRATHYANKNQKAIKSVWVHRRFSGRYFTKMEAQPLTVKPDMEGVRKYSPATFIKRYMRDFFDIAIFDECHLYKGGATGQGNAMDSLIKSSKKQLGLTGTIAGGMAEHMFYLFYRLDPAKMKEMGFEWGDVMKFTDTYGTMEREYEFSEGTREGNNNVMCRGRQLSSPKSKPGISPRIFTDFLIDCAVFLDLSDMSKFLPLLREQVVTVPLDNQEKYRNMFFSYQATIDKLRKQAKLKGGKGLLGKMLQFSLSYLDKPFGEESIINPKTGEIVARINQYPHLWEEGLLPKERKLVDLVKGELSEGRKCFVFAEYTASPNTCVTERLKRILEQELGIKVAILESSSPEPLKREAWIHEQAEVERVDVVITNPRCVETGLDFCWDKDGVRYNFPTLIFYQLGYSLFTVWQASRRHFRLNQREECRTYYMAYANTIQEVVIQLIAEKQVATSAIQGKFSVEGLSRMANGVDTKLIMAKALADNDFSSKNDLQGMFDVLAASQEDDNMSSCRQMPTLVEVIGEERLDELDALDRGPDIEDILADLFEDFDFIDRPEEPVFVASSDVQPETKEVSIMELFGF